MDLFRAIFPTQAGKNTCNAHTAITPNGKNTVTEDEYARMPPSTIKMFGQLCYVRISGTAVADV